MNEPSLWQVLRELLLPCRRIALVGAGGKTTAGLTLAREMMEQREPVLFTTTTHIFCPAEADVAVGVGEPESPAVWAAVASGRLPVLGREPVGRKLRGFSMVEMARIADFWPDHRLVVEADGSARRPLKAPGDHEPAIFPLADTVLYVAGLAGVGKPLTGEYVHRPERFSLLTGLPLGDIVRPRHVADLIRHPAGGHKNVPPGARLVVLLTGAATPEDFLMGTALARLLTAAGEERVLLTGLAGGRAVVRSRFGREGP